MWKVQILLDLFLCVSINFTEINPKKDNRSIFLKASICISVPGDTFLGEVPKIDNNLIERKKYTSLGLDMFKLTILS